MFNILVKYNILDKCPPWYSKISIKPRYENANIIALWDIPEYSGCDNKEENVLRPDGKLILKNEKIIYEPDVQNLSKILFELQPFKLLLTC